MQTGLNDTELISRILLGEQQLYEQLIRRYQDYVFTLTFRVIKNREDAEEVAQDVFIKAFRSLNNFKGLSKFSTWLYTIVRNTCITFLRKKELEIYSMDNENIFAKVNSQHSPFDANELEQKARIAMANKAIGLLSPDDAEIITLFYKAEQSLEEISNILCIETNAVKVRLHRARIRLKEKMEKHFAEEVKDLN